MDEDLLKILGVLFVVFVFFLAYLGYKKSLQFFRILGCRMEKFLPLKDDKKYFLKFGYKGRELIVISQSPVMGYLTIEFRRNRVSTTYDDERWAKTVLNSSKLFKLKEIGLKRLIGVHIIGEKIEFVFDARKKNDEFVKEVKDALEFFGEVIDSLKGLPGSSVGLGKEKIRKWLIYYIPVGIFALLSCIGLFSGYGGDSLCEDELFVLGFRVLTPLFLFHFLLTVLLLGKPLHPRRNIPVLFVLYFGGYYLIPRTILDPFNAILDNSEPVQLETRVVDKYPTYGEGFHLKLEGITCSHRVSEGLYKEVDTGDPITLFIKRGAFGVRWVYRYSFRAGDSS
jgi:hypothetical protein